MFKGRLAVRLGAGFSLELGARKNKAAPVAPISALVPFLFTFVIPPERIPDFRVMLLRSSVQHGGKPVLGIQYFKRQAATLLKFAQSTSDPQLAAVLVEKAADLKSQVDDAALPPDPSPQPPDVERRA